MKKHKNWIRKCIIILLSLVLVAGLAVLPHVIKVYKDFQQIKVKEHDTLLLSMFSMENYEEEDFAYYRAMQALKTEYCVPNGKLMRWYFAKAREYNNRLERVYLGVDPEHMAKEDVVLMLQQNPDILFEVILPYPCIEYWTGMKEEKFNRIMEEYQTFVEWILPLENANVYIFGNVEWLVCNPLNYSIEYTTNSEVSQLLMCSMDYFYPYIVDADNMQNKFEQYHKLYKEYLNRTYPDAKDLEILFFGDSIIGNFRDSMSIPQVVAGHTGADVYNFGCGGSCAADSAGELPSLTDMVDAFLSEDFSGISKDTAYYDEFMRYLEEGQETAPKLFVINYGLNDYFQGIPLESQDTFDVNTYSGALRLTVDKLKKAYPDARILLMSPHFTIHYNFGKDKVSEQGGTLADYGGIVVEIAGEMNVDILDNFSELGVNEENWQQYQPDGTHPNEMARYLFGSRIIEKIEDTREENNR